MSEFNKTPRLVLLPAVDVADGKAVRLTQGRGRHRDELRRPRRRRGRLGRPGRRVDPPRRPRRRVRPRHQRRHPEEGHPPGRAASTSSSPAASATTRRSSTRSRSAPSASTSAPRRSRTPSGRHPSSRSTARPIAVGLDVRGTTLAARGWTQDGGDLWQVLDRLEEAGCRPLRRHRRDEGRHAAGPEPRPAPPGHGPHRTARSSPRAASRASTTSPRCASSCRSASRARSSARRCTRAPSRCPRRWMSPGTDPMGGPSTDASRAVRCRARRDPRPTAADSAGVPWAGRSFEPNPHAADDGRAPEAPRGRPRGASAPATGDRATWSPSSPVRAC